MKTFQLKIGKYSNYNKENIPSRKRNSLRNASYSENNSGILLEYYTLFSFLGMVSIKNNKKYLKHCVPFLRAAAFLPSCFNRVRTNHSGHFCLVLSKNCQHILDPRSLACPARKQRA
jgi:hypothetical protein